MVHLIITHIVCTKGCIVNFGRSTKMSYKGKVFILNKPFEGVTINEKMALSNSY